MIMENISMLQAKGRLDHLIDKVVGTEEHVTITCKKGNMVLVAEDYWNAIQETIYLLSMPEVAKSIT
jgi:PHD/YefM family antitoxin component YafN of YafNO toxin-antitoxin module